ncbi:hypothetical protein JRO89_XS10G0138200 [Xanthoceras sorbifolium]|uniref:Pentatricopeptide repeat-containing protein n=1 Tax=Xanthoceras sorbifolium TaxID=99658 RepID=A0ABQ8HIL6_9ROSI|nr:hypothetical protein JRO89_XS10G0138200 [Xanthoceras sorbifolium]
MGSKHDYPSYASLIIKLARAHDFDAVETVLGYIQDYNIRCKEIIFIALMQHYGKARLVDKAIENGRLCDAKRMFDGSKEMGFRPNSISFNILIKGRWREESGTKRSIGFLCRNGDVEKAKGLVEDMVSKGKYPNAVTYALLMEGLCSQGEYNEAKKMMFDMAYRGCKPKLVNFGRGRAAEAYKVFIEMHVGGCEANAATYRMMVDGFCWLRILRQFEGFECNADKWALSSLETFCCLIVGLLKHGKTDNACFVLEEMEKRKMRFDKKAWEALIRDACVENECAYELVDELIFAL